MVYYNSYPYSKPALAASVIYSDCEFISKRHILVATCGVQWNIGNTPLISYQWFITISTYNENGLLDLMSTFGPSIERSRFMHPRVDITGTVPGGVYTNKWYNHYSTFYTQRNYTFDRIS